MYLWFNNYSIFVVLHGWMMEFIVQRQMTKSEWSQAITTHCDQDPPWTTSAADSLISSKGASCWATCVVLPSLLSWAHQQNELEDITVSKNWTCCKGKIYKLRESRFTPAVPQGSKRSPGKNVRLLTAKQMKKVRTVLRVLPGSAPLATAQPYYLPCRLRHQRTMD